MVCQTPPQDDSGWVILAILFAMPIVAYLGFKVKDLIDTWRVGMRMAKHHKPLVWRAAYESTMYPWHPAYRAGFHYFASFRRAKAWGRHFCRRKPYSEVNIVCKPRRGR